MRQKKLSDEERKEHARQSRIKYRENNKEKCKEHSNEWNANNREYFKKWREEHRDWLDKYRAEHRAERSEYTKRWREEHPERNKARDKRWRDANKEKRIAEKIAQASIPIGEICERCGAAAEARHHPDYSKPLEVVHLCTQCHCDIHKEGRRVAV